MPVGFPTGIELICFHQNEDYFMLCIHCEKRPAITDTDLCSICDTNEGIHVLYYRPMMPDGVTYRFWTPERERRLRIYTQRAKRGVPLTPDRSYDLASFRTVDHP